jgi:pyruvate dehydrogenase E1 component alpha subunit
MDMKKETLIDLLVNMLRARMLEERVIKLFTDGKSPGWIHPGRGQEAIGTGVCFAIRPTDIVFSSHRGRAVPVARGIDFGRALATLLGKDTGYASGRISYDSMCDKELGLYNATGTIGSVLPISTGVALACQIQQQDKIVVCFFGDGASNNGTFHESLNLAAVWKLPIVYVCENNGWAQFSAFEWVTSVTDVAKKAPGYGIPGVTVDGNDVLAVHEAAIPAVERARKGEGPTLIECKTRRWFGHYYGDPQRYRPGEDVEKAQSPDFDPIPRFRAKLIEMKVLTEEKIKEMEKTINGELDKAEKFADESPLPEAESALEHVYKGGN